jgi:hypothetical protein
MAAGFKDGGLQRHVERRRPVIYIDPNDIAWLYARAVVQSEFH